MKMDHYEAACEALQHFDAALKSLKLAADIMRSPSIDTSPQAMQTEIAITKAIDALSGNGFKAPKVG